ncbi:MAG: hypothetical protein KBD25_05510 [Rickettsiaceae bacterium]|nr:hypothetical protein [Rickettsiaceae bacterium]
MVPWYARNNEIFSENEPESILTVHKTSDHDGQIANAAFIVKAVNSHDELVLRLKQLIECVEPWINCQPALVTTPKQTLHHAKEALTTALAQVEKG